MRRMVLKIGKYIISILLVGAFYNCVSPKNFSYYYDRNYTGIDTLIRIDGYYISHRECDSSFYSLYMFYPDGLFTIATTSKLHPELISCFERGGNNSKLYSYPQWGIYRIVNDTIKTQTVRTDEQDCVFFRDYKILPDGQIINISDYVEPEFTRLGFMKRYPSFLSNECSTPAEFFTTKTKRDISECPFIGKKWFDKNEK